LRLIGYNFRAWGIDFFTSFVPRLQFHMISVDIEQGFGDMHFMNHPASLQLPTEQESSLCGELRVQVLS